MKKSKLLIMLLTVLVSCAFLTTNSKAMEKSDAANAETIEIPYSPLINKLDPNTCANCIYSGSSVFENNDPNNNKLLKFVVTDKNDVYRFNFVENFYDSNMNIIKVPCNTYDVLMDPGTYYIEIDNANIRKTKIFSSKIYIYRTSLEREMKNIIKYKKNYSNASSIFSYAYGYSFSGHNLIYGQTYTIKATDLYNMKGKKVILSYSLNIKNRSANPKISATGDLKKRISGNSTNETVKKADKKKPTVKGVKNNKTYKKAVKVKVSDKSGIKKVTLNGKKMKVSKFKAGYKIKKNGKYTLKVWDKCGNCRTVKFKIKK